MFALHGRLGLSFGKVSGNDDGHDSERLTGSRTSALVGIGAEYRPRPNVTLSVNFDHYGRLSENVTASAVVFGLHFTL